MAKVISMFSLTVLSLLTGYWVMTVGWGLTVKSWPVIVVGYLAVMGISFAIGLVSRD